MNTAMDILVTLHTTEYRGDHSTDITIACEVEPTETIVGLVDRLLQSHGGRYKHVYGDHIEIRVLTPKDILHEWQR